MVSGFSSRMSEHSLKSADHPVRIGVIPRYILKLCCRARERKGREGREEKEVRRKEVRRIDWRREIGREGVR